VLKNYLEFVVVGAIPLPLYLQIKWNKRRRPLERQTNNYVKRTIFFSSLFMEIVPRLTIKKLLMSDIEAFFEITCGSLP
jgi:hypothetical protein